MSTIANVGPVLEFFKPAIEVAASTVALTLLSVLGNLGRQLLKIQVSNAQYAMIRKAMSEEVERMVGEGVDKLATVNVDTKSELVARIANSVSANILPVTKRLGITDDDMRQLALSALGAYQISVEAAHAPVASAMAGPAVASGQFAGMIAPNVS